ncbi:MAG TPA: ABC transporter substrate-binding protein, partial [Planctomycetota bacterium]|nr:ABC transporter substrate-binding protein [Planctomycetota bacterium]
MADPKTLHPFYGSVQTETEVTDLIFESLVRLEPDFTFSPALAKSWEMSPDGLTLTFRLREDVVWHDGAPFTADDVAFTHKLATDPEAG